MSNDKKRADARPIFRWLAGLSGLACLLMVPVVAFPGAVSMDDEPSFLTGLLFLWVAIVFGIVAFTGSLPKGRKGHMQLYLAARKYASGQMSLEEYGSFTKKLLEEE